MGVLWGRGRKSSLALLVSRREASTLHVHVVARALGVLRYIHQALLTQ